MRKEFLIFGSPYLGEAEQHEVLDSMQQAWLGTGPKVEQFESDFGQFKGTPAVAAVSSCSAALHLSCLALGLKPGDEVITTAMTFCATINAIIHSGATPVLADIDPATLNIDPQEIVKKITGKTKAILVVHFAGRPCAMTEISAIAEQYNLKIIEDCAHALETEYKGQKAGTLGDLGCFSFYATKNITTGEGGMVTSREERLIEKVKIMAMNGLSADAWKRFSDGGHRHYFVNDIGFKYNMMDLQAAMGIHQLAKVNEFRQRREHIWRFYMDNLKELPVTLPASVEDQTRHAYHLFTIRIDQGRAGMSRDTFLQEMIKLNIGIGVHYPSVPEHPYYQNTFGWDPEDFPHARKYGAETVSIPLSAKLSDRDAMDVVEAVTDILPS
ncbi:MAG: DegT/DnrJ/EryC1/StrS family aminotransferase [Desulfuromonadales bacterium]|nr:DegT/DnrJ/EryC1/StrS family aminotransferase [Desulfuromonadales bacterium]